MAIIIGRDSQGADVVLPSDARQYSLYVIGTTGTGKSTLLENIASADMEHGDGVCFLDPHGTSVNRLLACIPPHRTRDVIYWHPRDIDRPFGLNPFFCPDSSDPVAVDGKVEDFLSALSGLAEFTETFQNAPHMIDVLRHLAFTFVLNQGYTLVETLAFLNNPAYRQQFYPAVARHRPDILSYWVDEFDRMSVSHQREFVSSTINKLRRLITTNITRSIFGQPTPSVDFRAVMDAGTILFVNLSDLGTGNGELVGAFIVFALLHAASSRSELSDTDLARLPAFHLYADEFERFMSTAFPQIIDETRKYKLYCVLAHQHRGGQLTQEARAATLGIKNKIVFQVNSEDARELAWSFDTTPAPGEPKLEPLTEPIKEEYTVTYWDPPEAQAAYERLGKGIAVAAVRERVLYDCFGGSGDLVMGHDAAETAALLNQFIDGYVPSRYYEEHLRNVYRHCGPAEYSTAVKDYVRAHLALASDVSVGFYWERKEGMPFDGTMTFPASLPMEAEERLELALGNPALGVMGSVLPYVASEFFPRGCPRPTTQDILAIIAPLLADIRRVFTPVKEAIGPHRYRFEYSSILHPRRADEPKKIVGVLIQRKPIPAALPLLRDLFVGIKRELASLTQQHHNLSHQAHKRETRTRDTGKVRVVRDVLPTGRPSYQRGRYIGEEAEEAAVYRVKEGPPLSTDEMANRIANELTHLPPYTARCILAGREYTITTIKPPQPEEGSTQRAQAIKDHSRHTYGADRAMVEAEIAQRLAPRPPTTGSATIKPDADRLPSAPPTADIEPDILADDK